ncbi:hypothetical protein [Achromobacter xylosoxidans]|uniref:hypothetical protein n=1 Tax=Alcaligenes xylosoxydans xylosoxydans TaxID=85698 RepID=UPI003D06DDFB
MKDAELLLKKFGAPGKPVGGKYDMWPRYPGVFIRRPVEHDAGDEAVSEREAIIGRRGAHQRHDRARQRGQGR